LTLCNTFTSTTAEEGWVSECVHISIYLLQNIKEMFTSGSDNCFGVLKYMCNKDIKINFVSSSIEQMLTYRAKSSAAYWNGGKQMFSSQWFKLKTLGKCNF